jgi:glycerol-3-phosphate acyltransferase PlsY
MLAYNFACMFICERCGREDNGNLGPHGFGKVNCFRFGGQVRGIATYSCDFTQPQPAIESLRGFIDL